MQNRSKIESCIATMRESAYARAMTLVTTFYRFCDYYVVFRVFYVLIWAVSSVGMQMTFGAIKKEVSKNTISFL